MSADSRGDAPPKVLGVILGGGRGTRLYPLTRYRSKPAVPLAGKYRLIDVPLSNCIHSDIRQVYVLTQFNSASLNRHLMQTYRFDNFTDGFVEILAAEQTLETEMWFQGTADAVRKSLRHILGSTATHVLILSGDMLYHQDFTEMIALHVQNDAEITVCCGPVNSETAPALGILGIDEHRRITRFVEKPQPAALAPLRTPPETLAGWGFPDSTRPFLASMGTYLFRKDVLAEVLRESAHADFGKQVIPEAISTRRVFAHLFRGYWEDIGTIRSFFRANMDLLSDQPRFDFNDSVFPVYTRSRMLPSSRVVDSQLMRVMVAEGCLIRNATIRNSVLGIRSVIGDGAHLENVVMMGADYYEAQRPPCAATAGRPALGIGRGAVVRNAIIDKDARVGDGARIENSAGVTHFDGESYTIRDGIVIIPKDGIVPAGSVI